MNILVLIPRQKKLEYAIFKDTQLNPIINSNLYGLISDRQTIADALDKINNDCIESHGLQPDRIVVRAPYGGSHFNHTTPVNSEMLSLFASLAADSPLHIPPIHILATNCLEKFPKAKLFMAFETAFFIDLPLYEQRYGITAHASRRFGYHGLFHQAASMEGNDLNDDKPTRILSLCLEPRTELVAIAGDQPVMTTSGTTPLEGLPGETTSGEIDPTILLNLAKDQRWGPEQINTMLTQQSGLFALLDRPALLGDLLRSMKWNKREHEMPSSSDHTATSTLKVFAYRVLLAAGAGISALGGVDRIILSGKYAKDGHKLGQWLAMKLRPPFTHKAQPIPLTLLPLSLSRILANHALSV